MAAEASKRLTVAIIGAGVAGPTFGLQLLSHPRLAARFKPILFDASPDPGHSSTADERQRNTQPSTGAAVGVFANGLYPLYKLGLRDEIYKHSTPFIGLQFWKAHEDGRHKLAARTKNPTWSADIQDHARSISRQDLQRLLINAFQEKGGEVRWDTSFERISSASDGQVEVTFSDTTTVAAHLVVGADGGFSSVRRHILQSRNPVTAEERWLPEFQLQHGFYAISHLPARQPSIHSEDTHGIFIESGGIISSAPLPHNRIRWDLILPSETPPSATDATAHLALPNDSFAPSWAAALLPSPYAPQESILALSKLKDVYHPVAGSIGNLLTNAERIIHRPLRQQVWKAEEIQHGNVVLIGDSSRLMLPSSGQGTGFAVEDATVLAKHLLQSYCEEPPAESFASALEQYAKERVPRSRKMAAVAYWAGELSLGRKWYYRLMRNWMPLPGDRIAKPGIKESWPFDGRFDLW